MIRGRLVGIAGFDPVQRLIETVYIQPSLFAVAVPFEQQNGIFIQNVICQTPIGTVIEIQRRGGHIPVKCGIARRPSVTGGIHADRVFDDHSAEQVYETFGPVNTGTNVEKARVHSAYKPFHRERRGLILASEPYFSAMFIAGNRIDNGRLTGKILHCTFLHRHELITEFGVGAVEIQVAAVMPDFLRAAAGLPISEPNAVFRPAGIQSGGGELGSARIRIRARKYDRAVLIHAFAEASAVKRTIS